MKEHPDMQRTARIFMNNRSQAVRLPKDFQVRASEVFIRKVGDEIILSPRPSDWSAYLEDGPVGSPTFMDEVEDLPLQDRGF
jgi:antitoxin VapB